MALKTFTFSGGGTLTADYSGSGNNTVSFSASENQGDQREMDLTFHTASNRHSVTRHVIQEESPYTYQIDVDNNDGDIGLNITMQTNSGSNISNLTFSFNGDKKTTSSSPVQCYNNNYFNIRASKSTGNEYVLATSFATAKNGMIGATVYSNFPLVNLYTCFNNCISLESLSLNLNITNMANCCLNDRALTSFTWTRDNTRGNNITNMAYCFNCCTNLTSLDLNYLYGINVTSIFRMCNYCGNLTTVNLRYFYGNSLTNMSNAFNGCTNLTTCNLYSFRGNNVLNMSRMFSNCRNITSINLRAFYGNNVTNAAYAFNCCLNCTAINLRQFYGYVLTDMSLMFNGCYNLSTINLSYFYGNNVTNMSYTFQFCRNATSINLRRIRGSESGVNMYGTFASCYSLIEVNLPSFSSPITNCAYLFLDCNELQEIMIGDFLSSNVGSLDYMYAYCYALAADGYDLCTGINIANVTTMRGTFTDSSLTSFPYFTSNSSVLTNIAYICRGCANLKNVNSFSRLGTGNNVNCYYAFYGCSNLTNNMVIPFTDISNATLMFNGRANSTIIPVYCNSENAYNTIFSALNGIYNESWLILLCYNGYTYRVAGDLSYPNFTTNSDTNAGVSPELGYAISYPVDSMTTAVMSNRGAIISYTLLNTSSYTWASNISMDENGVVSFEMDYSYSMVVDTYTIANVLATLKWGNTTVNVTSPVYYYMEGPGGGGTPTPSPVS